MSAEAQEGQLELFDLTGQSAPRPSQRMGGRLLVQLRRDHLLLVGVAGLLGVTVIFASGVERGKQLARTERVLLAPPQRMPSVSDSTKPTPVTAPSAPPGNGAPAAGARPSGRYAVQVVTYSAPSRAQRELQRLQGQGEQAFLVKRDGHTMVYVGPFASRDHARKKLTMLKTRYGDCFVKAL